MIQCSDSNGSDVTYITRVLIYTLIHIEQKKNKKVLKRTESIVVLKELFKTRNSTAARATGIPLNLHLKDKQYGGYENNISQLHGFRQRKKLMFQGEDGENIRHKIISRTESADDETYKMNVEKNTSLCEPTPFYPPTPTLFDTSTASTEDHRTDQDACAAEALLQLKFQSTSTNVQTKNAKEKYEPSCTKQIYARPKNDSICASENRINVLLDLLCQEKDDLMNIILYWKKKRMT